MDEVHVVTCFLEKDGQVALLRRSGRVGTYPGRWAGVSGYIEAGASAKEQAWRELAEEVGLLPEDLELIREGNQVEVEDTELQRKWVVHPFRFRVVKPDRVKLDWEHIELRWVQPSAIPSFDTVPGLLAAWQRVAD